MNLLQPAFPANGQGGFGHQAELPLGNEPKPARRRRSASGRIEALIRQAVTHPRSPMAALLAAAGRERALLPFGVGEHHAWLSPVLARSGTPVGAPSRHPGDARDNGEMKGTDDDRG
jgi:hypothetical protein